MKSHPTNLLNQKYMNPSLSRRLAVATVTLALLLFATTFARAQSYTLDAFTVDGGGGTSSGGDYEVSGTIGETDASASMSGGEYAVDGGFLTMFAAVQTPGAPVLTMSLTTTNTVVLSWPTASTSFALEQTSDLGTPTWASVGITPTVNGITSSVVMPVTAGNKFFRLRNQ